MPQGSSYLSCKEIVAKSFVLGFSIDFRGLSGNQRIYYKSLHRAARTLHAHNYRETVIRMNYFLEMSVSDLLENTDMLQVARPMIEHIMDNIICLEARGRFRHYTVSERASIQNAIDRYYRLVRIYNLLDQGLDEDAIIAQEGDVFEDDFSLEQGGGAVRGGGEDHLDALFAEDSDDEQGGDDDDDDDEACDATDDADCEVDDGLS